MTLTHLLSTWLESFFTDRLLRQRQVSPHTIASYRDTFRLLLAYGQQQTHKTPSQMFIEDLDATFIGSFLDDLETKRKTSARSRNVRLAAIRSFFRYLAFHLPERSTLIQRVLSMPNKRFERKLIVSLDRSEVEALLRSPDPHTWIGQRDHTLLMLMIQTGLRVSEITSLQWKDLHLGQGAYVACLGKGRKQRCTPLTKQMVKTLKVWKKRLSGSETDPVFPSQRGESLSVDSVQYLLKKYLRNARKQCSSLREKEVSPHVLRHTTAMHMLQTGVDRAVIALWLGHESVETTQIYLDANLKMKEEILAMAHPLHSTMKPYQPGDQLLSFLKNL